MKRLSDSLDNHHVTAYFRNAFLFNYTMTKPKGVQKIFLLFKNGIVVGDNFQVYDLMLFQKSY